MLSDEIKVNDTVTFEVTKIFENPDGVKMFKLGEYYLTEDTLNKMGISSITTTASTVYTKSPFDRVEKDETYYLIDTDGKVYDSIEAHDEIDEAIYNAGNYCTDEKLLSQRAMHETLNRLLWRYSEENGGSGDWETPNNHWFIYKDTNTGVINSTYSTFARQPGTIYFKSETIANEAIAYIVLPFIEEHPAFDW